MHVHSAVGLVKACMASLQVKLCCQRFSIGLLFKSALEMSMFLLEAQDIEDG